MYNFLLIYYCEFPNRGWASEFMDNLLLSAKCKNVAEHLIPTVELIGYGKVTGSEVNDFIESIQYLQPSLVVLDLNFWNIPAIDCETKVISDLVRTVIDCDKANPVCKSK